MCHLFVEWALGGVFVLCSVPGFDNAYLRSGVLHNPR